MVKPGPVNIEATRTRSYLAPQPPWFSTTGFAHLTPTGHPFLLPKSHWFYSKNHISVFQKQISTTEYYWHYWSNLIFFLLNDVGFQCSREKKTKSQCFSMVVFQARVAGRAVQRARGDADTWPQRLYPRGWSFTMFHQKSGVGLVNGGKLWLVNPKVFHGFLVKLGFGWNRYGNRSGAMWTTFFFCQSWRNSETLVVEETFTSFIILMGMQGTHQWNKSSFSKGSNLLQILVSITEYWLNELDCPICNEVWDWHCISFNGLMPQFPNGELSLLGNNSLFLRQLPFLPGETSSFCWLTQLTLISSW